MLGTMEDPQMKCSGGGYGQSYLYVNVKIVGVFETFGI